MNVQMCLISCSFVWLLDTFRSFRFGDMSSSNFPHAAVDTARGTRLKHEETMLWEEKKA